MSYTVRSGDYLSKIAAEHGIANWRTIYDHPDNAGFQPHYADLAWPIVTDFLQRRV